MRTACASVLVFVWFQKRISLMKFDSLVAAGARAPRYHATVSVERAKIGHAIPPGDRTRTQAGATRS